MRTWSLRVLRQSLRLALSALDLLAAAVSAAFKSRAALQMENLALRHQLGVLRRSVKRPKLTSADRLLWAWLCDVWNDWRSALVIVKPETVIAWHRKGFRLFWTSKVRSGQPGRPAVPKDVRELIRKMSRENPLWGAPRIHGELLKLGIDIGETSVAKYMVRQRKPPSQTWRTFLENHVKTLVSVDFFTVPTIRFQVLYVFLVLAHDRRRIVHFGVTAHPTAEWTAQQLRDAFPWDTAPRYLLRDRDRTFGDEFTKQVKDMGIQEVLSAPRSPWLLEAAGEGTILAGPTGTTPPMVSGVDRRPTGGTGFKGNDGERPAERARADSGAICSAADSQPRRRWREKCEHRRLSEDFP